MNCENVRCLRPVIIHRGKYKNLSSVMEPMVLIMNFFSITDLISISLGKFGGQGLEVEYLDLSIQQLDDLGVVKFYHEF